MRAGVFFLAGYDLVDLPLDTGLTEQPDQHRLRLPVDVLDAVARLLILQEGMIRVEEHDGVCRVESDGLAA